MQRVTRGLASSLFNVLASIVLVVIASGVMVWFIRTDPDSAATFSPVYVLVLCLIGGFLFSGRGGKWVTVKLVIQALGIFVILPLAILVYGTYWTNVTIEHSNAPNRSMTELLDETNSPSRR
jgi:peptidoglycan/LPS O-acetylase OafA/YrhL